MKTGRLELMIYDGKYLRYARDEDGMILCCETEQRMEIIKEKYSSLLKDGEEFRVKENW